MATQRLQVYRCGVCGNMVEVVHASSGTLTCCNQAMTLQEENSVDAAGEKHVPVVEKVEGGVKVKVGEVPHPMADEHYIEWVQVISGGKSYRQFLEPGGKPEAVFPVQGNDIVAREFCNLHGLWKG